MTYEMRFAIPIYQFCLKILVFLLIRQHFPSFLDEADEY